MNNTVNERVFAYEQRQKKKGLARVIVWVPKDKKDKIIKLAEELRK